jgi:HAMP domain-containing protein
MAEVDAWDVCFFKFTYIPLSQVVFPRLGMIYKDRTPQFFGLLDESGKTARVWIKNLEAQIRGSENLDIFLESLQYKKYRQENIPMLIPAVGELAQSQETDLSTILVDNDQVYQILIHKILGDNSEAVGYFLIGYALDSGMAVYDVKQFMGLRPKLEECMADEISDGSKAGNISPATCAREAALQDRAVTYLLRNLQGSVELKGSSLPPEEAEDIKRVVSKSAEAWTFKSDTTTAMVADVPVDYLPNGQRLMAVLSVDTCKAMPWYFDALRALAIAGIVLFIIGGILMLWLLRAYKRPFEEIETAVHEVITGNAQARIPFEYGESLPRSLGQSISIMRSVLLGEPLPEEQQQETLWGAQDNSPVGDDVSVAAPCHVDEPGETVSAKELEEPLPVYYARIYKDYCDILVAAGAAVDMDLPAFTESVKSTEKKLLDIYKCKGFRFKIEAREGRPNMVPFCIR